MKRLPLPKEVHWVLCCQISRIENLTDISNCLGDIISCPHIDLTLPAGVYILAYKFYQNNLSGK